MWHGSKAAYVLLHFLCAHTDVLLIVDTREYPLGPYQPGPRSRRCAMGRSLLHETHHGKPNSRHFRLNESWRFEADRHGNPNFSAMVDTCIIQDRLSRTKNKAHFKILHDYVTFVFKWCLHVCVCVCVCVEVLRHIHIYIEREAKEIMLEHNDKPTQNVVRRKVQCW
jgi:hypothetical protein